MKNFLAGLCLAVTLSCSLTMVGAEELKFTRSEDIVYGRKFGMALTLDVFTPEKPNGAAVIWIISGGWVSNHDGINVGRAAEFLNRGYTVFAVVHGCQPRFTIPEAVADLQRSVRFIKHNAQRWNIDPARIGVTGASAGGHLSLMLGTSSAEGVESAKDPVDRQSSRVQAVGCFYPPTDFFNYGQPQENALGRGTLANYKAPFAFNRLDPTTRTFEPITDAAEIDKIGKMICPVTHVTADDAPALIIHGDADKLVPIQQAEVIIAAFEQAKVPCKLVRKPGLAHGWAQSEKDLVTIADWFDEQLKVKP